MIAVLDALLAPLARLLVARGVLFPELSEILKGHYISAAESLAAGRVTDSKLSVMTGLQRRDIVRLRGLERTKERPNHLARLVAQWQAEALPKVLPNKGPAPSFDALARSIRQDVHPRTMLDALITAGTVEYDATADAVHLISTSYQPLAGSEDQLSYLTHNLGDHISAATENVLADTPPHFERAVHYSHLTPEQIATLEQDYRTGQIALMETLNKKAAKMQKDSGGEARDRFRAGGYFYKADEGK